MQLKAVDNNSKTLWYNYKFITYICSCPLSINQKVHVALAIFNEALMKKEKLYIKVIFNF